MGLIIVLSLSLFVDIVFFAVPQFIVARFFSTPHTQQYQRMTIRVIVLITKQAITISRAKEIQANPFYTRSRFCLAALPEVRMGG